MEWLVRLCAAEAGEVLTLQRAAYVSEAQAHGDLELPPLRQNLDALAAELSDPYVSALGWRDEHDRLVAAVRARRCGHPDETWVEIGRLTVAPDRQGQGLGSGLLTALEDQLPVEVTELRLFTGEHSHDNLRLYHRLQFVETAREPTPAGYDLVHLRKTRSRDPQSRPAAAVGGDLRLAFEAADLAAQVSLTYFEAGVTSTPKLDGTPVTEADRAVERLLRETLSRAQPHDAVLGEELGESGESDRVWILDPIDGTGLFSQGDPNWRVHIALEVNGTVQLAVVTSPALRRCWWATRGGGSFESSWPREDSQTHRLAVSTTSALDGAVMETLDGEDRKRLPPSGAAPSTSPLPLVELVRGQIDAFLAERYSTWDHAPWILLVEEAGGRFTDRAGGHASNQGGGLYSNAHLHTRLLAWLHYPPSAL